MFINIHIIQNFPASNLNRDDTGAPKDTIFGGVRRARISSQCQKRSIRTHKKFQEEIMKKNSNTTFGNRSRHFTEIFKNKALELFKLENDMAANLSEALILSIGPEKKDGKVEYLLYLSDAEIDKCFEYLNQSINTNQGNTKKVYEKMINEWQNTQLDQRANSKKKSWKKTLSYKDFQKFLKKNKTDTMAPDIAIFGRFVSDNENMNIDAACQVAHAISTHKTALETDYYTAVDDLLPDDQSGSGMMGVIEYNGACYYRYANIDLEKLKENLGQANQDLVAATVLGFIKAMVMAIPTGMQNSFAAQSYPAYVKVMALDMPISYANAFCKPIRNREDESIEEKSIEALKNFEERQLNFFGKTPVWEAEASLFEKDKTIASLLQEVGTKLTEE